MAKDPDERYATTMELAHAAHAAVTVPAPRRDVPVETRPKPVPADPGHAPTQPARNADRDVPQQRPRNRPAFEAVPTHKRSRPGAPVPATPSGTGTGRKLGLWFAAAAVVVAVIIGTVVAVTQSGHKSATGPASTSTSSSSNPYGSSSSNPYGRSPEVASNSGNAAVNAATVGGCIETYANSASYDVMPCPDSFGASSPYANYYYRVVRRTQDVTECSADQLAVQASDTKVIICLEPWFGQSPYGR